MLICFIKASLCSDDGFVCRMCVCVCVSQSNLHLSFLCPLLATSLPPFPLSPPWYSFSIWWQSCLETSSVFAFPLPWSPLINMAILFFVIHHPIAFHSLPGSGSPLFSITLSNSTPLIKSMQILSLSLQQALSHLHAALTLPPVVLLISLGSRAT